jgi:GTP-binding protein Era
VLTRPEAQIVFYDTPGVNRGRARFNRAMSEAALATAQDADLRVLLLDASAHWDSPEERVAKLRSPRLLVRTKLDLGSPTALPVPERFDETLEVSARTGQGLAHFVERVTAYLPESPPLYPEDYLTDRPVRFFAAEQVREVALELYRDEIPYGLAVEIEQWKETEAEVRIRANILVERENHKGIVVGAEGRMLKTLGSEARKRLRGFLDKTVHLNLWVKSDRNWTKNPRRARELGYL